jgi:hypothetical protein
VAITILYDTVGDTVVKALVPVTRDVIGVDIGVDIEAGGRGFEIIKYEMIPSIITIITIITESQSLFNMYHLS